MEIFKLHVWRFELEESTIVLFFLEFFLLDSSCYFNSINNACYYKCTNHSHSKVRN
jgi:hypothetical protein